MNSIDSAPRVYRSELRVRQAAETRERIILAAVELFAAEGYQGTTMSKIARRAGVSVETVHKNGPKSALVRAALEVAGFGIEGDTDYFDLEFGQALAAIEDPAALPAFAGATATAVNSGLLGVWIALTHGAPSDAELAEAFTAMLAAIRRQNATVLAHVRDRGWLRDDVPFDELVETLSIITSVETYQRIVQLDGGSEADYGRVVARMVRDCLLRR